LASSGPQKALGDFHEFGFAVTDPELREVRHDIVSQNVENGFSGVFRVPNTDLTQERIAVATDYFRRIDSGDPTIVEETPKGPWRLP
jgi:hypothetical protein